MDFKCSILTLSGSKEINFNATHHKPELIQGEHFICKNEYIIRVIIMAVITIIKDRGFKWPK